MSRFPRSQTAPEISSTDKLLNTPFSCTEGWWGVGDQKLFLYFLVQSQKVLICFYLEA